MKIDLEKEHPLTLADVPKHVPKRGGKKVHYSTVYRWTTKGARGRVLESVMVGGIRYTTIEAVRRFLRAEPSITPKGPVSTNAAIENELSKAGV